MQTWTTAIIIIIIAVLKWPVVFQSAPTFPVCSVSRYYVLPVFSVSAGCPRGKGHSNSRRSKESVIAIKGLETQAESALCPLKGDGKKDGKPN